MKQCPGLNTRTGRSPILLRMDARSTDPSTQFAPLSLIVWSGKRTYCVETFADVPLSVATLM